MKLFLIKSVVILQLFSILATGLGINKSYAENTELEKKFIVKQAEETGFMVDIKNTETDTLKIKNIDKKISEDNYMEKEITETKTLARSNEDYIKSQFGTTKDFNDGEYKGTLELYDIDIKTISNGSYEKIDEKVLSFTNYTDNDLNNIEKEIKINGETYYLINVDWEMENSQVVDNENVPTTYKGRKIYQTVQTLKNPNTYKVTVTYKGKLEKLNTIYEYTINYEKIKPVEKEEVEEIKEEKKSNISAFIVSGLGLTVLFSYLLNMKNTYVYVKAKNGFKLIKKVRLSNKNLSIDITDYNNKSNEEIYAIKINPITFKLMKKRTITVIKGTQRKDLTLWNNYYEIRF